MEDEIDLRELFSVLWSKKKLVAGVTGFAAVASVIYALVLTDIYRAEAMLTFAEGQQPAGLASQYGGAAALLGVNIDGNLNDQTNTAIAILQSRQFIGRFIEENNLLVPLFAARWDRATQSSVINNEVYDVATNSWLLENGAPSSSQAYRKFRNLLLVDGPDRATGIITVAIEWYNPYEASKWVNSLVSALNQEMRTRDVREANNAISYLRQQIETTQLVDMQRVFYQLIESQTRITMLADVRDEYVFRVIDPAVVPDRRYSPMRYTIALIGTIAGSMLAIIFVLMRRVFLKSDAISKKG